MDTSDSNKSMRRIDAQYGLTRIYFDFQDLVWSLGFSYIGPGRQAREEEICWN